MPAGPFEITDDDKETGTCLVRLSSSKCIHRLGGSSSDSRGSTCQNLVLDEDQDAERERSKSIVFQAVISLFNGTGVRTIDCSIDDISK